ncbi:MAG: hypothetical protein ACHQQQ_12650 [Bacteroidota bacterium]
MKHNVAIIDDAIPIDERGIIEPTDRITSSDLKVLLSQNWGHETALKMLVSELLKSDNVILSCFKHPEHYFSSVESEHYRPDILIFDWEFPGSEDPPDDLLLEILQQTFCVVGIYSGAEKIEEISTTLDGEQFTPYKERVTPFDKSDTDSQKTLMEKVVKMYETNFAFKFGHDLRQKILKAADEMFVDLGKIHLDQAIALIGKGEDLKEIVVEKIRNQLESINFESLKSSKEAGGKTLTFEIARNLWSYRLYYNPTDDLVRRGDIIVEKISEIENFDKLYVVLNADCDLHSFWNKNFGSVNLVEIHRVTESYTSVIDRIKTTWPDSDAKPRKRISSLTTKLFDKSDDLLAIPFIRIKEKTELSSYVLFPKDILTMRVPSPPEFENLIDNGKVQKRRERKTFPLKYSHWNNIRRITSFSEPFRTPLILHILNAISGYGVPDYPPDLKTEIIKEFPGLS